MTPNEHRPFYEKILQDSCDHPKWKHIPGFEASDRKCLKCGYLDPMYDYY